MAELNAPALESVPPVPEQRARRVSAFRWELHASVPIAATAAVLATDRLRTVVVNGLEDSRDPEDFLLGGHGPTDETQRRFGRHAHAHWLWVEDANGNVSELACWVPAGLGARQRDRVLGVRELPRYRYSQRGYLPGRLSLSGLGTAEVVLSDLGAGASAAVWESATPYLMSLHTKPKRDFGELVEKDLQRQLDSHFGESEVSIVALLAEREARPYRRSRWDPGHAPSPAALRIVRLELDQTLPGPLLLGALSHFGYGRFRPVN